MTTADKISIESLKAIMQNGIRLEGIAEAYAEVLRANGWTVSKKRERKASEAPRLNAIGRPYGVNFDPKYRIKHKVSMAALTKPYSDNFRSMAFRNGA